MTTIPASIDDVTATWLAEVTGLPVEAVGIEQIGMGIGVSSALYRAHLDTGSGLPTSVVIKLPALDDAAVFTSTVLSMYRREVTFFNELASGAPIRVPRCHHASVDADSHFVVVMEDLGEHRVVDQLEGMTLDDAHAAVDALARWHAAWWGKADALAEAGATLSLADPIYPAVLPMVVDEGWDKLVAAGIAIPAAIEAVRSRFNAAIPGLLADLAQGPNTMVHGDFRADNLVFDDSGTVAAFDFQLIGTGSGSYDLAYFITQSLEVDLAAQAERPLFDRWTRGLLAGGVSAGDLGLLWEDYRKAALFCLVYPVVASRGMDLDDPRQRGLVGCMLRRFDRAVDQLSLAELL